jgi:hypothetical protein
MSDATYHRPRRQARRRPMIEYRLVVALSFPLFLVAAAAARLRPATQPAWPGAEPRPSLFVEAWRKAEATVSLAFGG